MTVTVAEFLSISFSHHMEILSGAKPVEERLFYVHEAALRHFNLDQLRDSIKRDDFHHRGEMPSNSMATIPDTVLARKTLAMFRDEYLLDFVNLDDIEAATGEDVDERVVFMFHPMGVCGFTRYVHINRLRNDTVLAAWTLIAPGS